MTNDTIKDIINDTRDLAATRKNPLTRLALEGIANRLQALCDAGLYIPPKAAVEALNAEKQTDAERLKRYHTVRYTGIEFKRYFSPHFVRLVGSFVNPAGDKNQNHVYELLVKESASRPGRWIAKGTNDGRELFTLTCASKWGAERYGFGALRSYLTRHLRRTIKANKAKEGK